MMETTGAEIYGDTETGDRVTWSNDHRRWMTY